MKRILSLLTQYIFLFYSVHLILWHDGWAVSTGLTLLIGLVYLLPAYLRVRYLTEKLNDVKVKNRQGFVYGFADWGQLLPTVKIGRETTKGQRLSSHKTAAPFGIFIYFDFEVADSPHAENLLHAHFNKWRIKRTNEWFYLLSPYTMVELWMISLLKGK